MLNLFKTNVPFIFYGIEILEQNNRIEYYLLLVGVSSPPGPWWYPCADVHVTCDLSLRVQSTKKPRVAELAGEIHSPDKSSQCCLYDYFNSVYNYSLDTPPKYIYIYILKERCATYYYY